MIRLDHSTSDQSCGSTRLLSQRRDRHKYQLQAQQSSANGDFKLARSYFERYKQDNTLSDVQRFFWAQILSKTGENEQASLIINELAPTNETGVPQAHFVKVLNIGAKLKSKPAQQRLFQEDPKFLSKLRWHLQHCNDETPKALEIWALMHAMAGKTDKSIARLKQSAKLEPTHYLVLAELAHRSTRYEQRDDALAAAEPISRKRSEDDGLDVGSRLLLAQILVKQ